jgi:hypothetical protein
MEIERWNASKAHLLLDRARNMLWTSGYANYRVCRLSSALFRDGTCDYDIYI